MGKYYSVRDMLLPPKEKAILFVAHPDDEVLFFHSFIDHNKPYVVLLTTGGLLRRVVPFCRTMKQYGVRYRTYDMPSRAVEQENLLNSRIKDVLRHGKYDICVTHNSEGEYGHEMHKCVHRCVLNSWSGKLLVPYGRDTIEDYPLSNMVMEQKNRILQTCYKGEYQTIKTFETWITHEGLHEFIR